MENKCREVERLLFAYIDGELGESDARFVAAHLAECLGCRSVEEAERRVKAMLREAGHAPVDETALRARLKTALDHAPPGAAIPSVRRPMRRRWMPLAVAATLALAAGLVFMYQRYAPYAADAEHHAEAYKEGVFAGTFVCVLCELTQKGCTHGPDHLPGLKLPDGSLWTIVRNDATAHLFGEDAFAALGGKALRFEGRIFPTARYADAARVE